MTVTNNNKTYQGISIHARFYDQDGQLLDAQTNSVLLAPGKTNEWSLPQFHADETEASQHLDPIRGYATCLLQKGPVRSGDVQFVYEGPATSE